MFPDASAAKGLDQIDVSELKHANIRPFLEKKFGIVTRRSSHLVQTMDPDTQTRKLFHLNATGEHYEIHVTAFSYRQQPTYFQRIFIAIADCALMF